MPKLKEGFVGSRKIVLPEAIQEMIKGDSFASSLYITDIGYYPTAKYHYRFREHGAKQYVLLYCRKGDGWVRVKDKQYTLRENQLIVLPPDIEHEYGASEASPWTLYWIHFHGSLSKHFAEGLDSPFSIPFSEDSRIFDRLVVFEDIYRALTKSFDMKEIQYANSALYYFLGTIKHLSDYRSGHSEGRTDSSIIERCRHYLMENIERKITQEELCEYTGYSKSSLSLQFHREIGISPMRYIQRVRLETAINLLEKGGMKINQVCYKVGISDPYYFSRLFRKVTGRTASSYLPKKSDEF